MAQRVATIASPDPPAVATLHPYGLSATVREPTWTFYSDCLHVYRLPLFFASTPSKMPHFVPLSCLLRLLMAVTVSPAVLVFDD